MGPRRLRAQCSVSIDGYSSGPGGPAEDSWLHKHAVQETTLALSEGVWRGCSSAILGRCNYEGFHAVWPGITADPTTDDRTRDLGRWLQSVDKAVVSTTLTEATWESSRVFPDPVTAVETLRDEEGRDILVLNSASVIGTLLREDLLDDLHLYVVPVLLGGGLRLLPDGVSSTWELASSATTSYGVLSLHYRRAR